MNANEVSQLQVGDRVGYYRKGKRPGQITSYGTGRVVEVLKLGSVVVASESSPGVRRFLKSGLEQANSYAGGARHNLVGIDALQCWLDDAKSRTAAKDAQRDRNRRIGELVDEIQKLRNETLNEERRSRLLTLVSQL